MLRKQAYIFVRNLSSYVVQYKCYFVQNCTILEGSRDSRLRSTSQQLENPTMACACKVEDFATAVRAREVRPDVVVPHSEVSQIVDILGLVCQTDDLMHTFVTLWHGNYDLR